MTHLSENSLASFFRRLIGMVALLSLVTSLGAQQLDGIAVLREKLDASRQKLEQPLNEFRAKYITQLGSLKSKAQAAGDLDKVLAIDKEIEMAPTGGSQVPAKYRELAKLRGIFDSHIKKLAEKRDANFRRSLTEYRESVRKYQVTLTKAGKIDEAKRAKFEVDAVDAQLKAGPSAFTAGGSTMLRSSGAAGKLILFGEYDDEDKEFGLTEAQKRASFTRVATASNTWLALEESGKPITNTGWHKGVPEGTKGIVGIECGRHMNAGIGKDGVPVFFTDKAHAKFNPVFEPGALAKLSLGHSLNVALMKDGTARVFGGVYGTVPDFPTTDLVKDVVDVTAGLDIVVLRRKDGQIHFLSSKGNPRRAAMDGKDVIAMESGVSRGVVFLWKDGKVTGYNVKDPPADLKKAVQIRVGYDLAAAQHEDGTWTVWGHNERAVISMNAKLKELGPLKDLAVGSKHFIAIQ